MEWIAESLESIVRGGGWAEWSTGGDEVEEGFGEKQDGDGAEEGVNLSDAETVGSEEQLGFLHHRVGPDGHQIPEPAAAPLEAGGERGRAGGAGRLPLLRVRHCDGERGGVEGGARAA